MNAPLYDNSADNTDQRCCPQCTEKSQKRLPKYCLDDWKIVSCSHCDFVYLANPVSYEALMDDHAWEKNAAKEDERRSKERPIIDGIGKVTRVRLSLYRKDRTKLFRDIFKKGRIVDVGCGGGTSLPEPLLPYGIEISRELAKQADNAMKQRGGRCIHASAIDGLKECEDRYFNGVLLNSFLEHEVNPLTLLQEAHRALKDDGTVYVRLPNFASLNRKVMGRNWCGFRFPDHVNYFTPKSLETMCKQAGFKMRLINPISIHVDDNIKAVLTKI